MLGIDTSIKCSQDKFTRMISLGDGDGLAMTKLFKEEGGDWHQFQQLKLPHKICGETITVKRKKKEDEVLVFDIEKELSLSDIFKTSSKITASAKKKLGQGITQEEYSQLLIEKNYHFPLTRLTRLSLRPMLLKLRVDTKKENIPKKTEEITHIQDEIEDNDYIVEAPIKTVKEEDELELDLNIFTATINPKQLKAKLWKQIEESKEGVMYKTEFSSLFSSIQTNQQCSAQACFVCLLHLANEKGIG